MSYSIFQIKYSTLLRHCSELKLACKLKKSYTIFNGNSALEQASERMEYFIRAFTLTNIPKYQGFTNILIN